MDSIAQLIVLQTMGGKEFTALVKPTQNGVMFTTALGQSEVKRQSLREVCEKLLTLCNEPQRKDVGI